MKAKVMGSYKQVIPLFIQKGGLTYVYVENIIYTDLNAT